ncbi:hypothetical protein [Pseudomonas sp. MWU12-2029]|uniref:hypothetical protein n=1 Tax=Pseudomonas sp. MWU12-2029 TaxID=2927805 RepID=UPI003999608C
MGIGHFLGVGFVAGSQPLLERQPLVLLGLLRGGGRHRQLVEGFGVQPCLLGQLLPVTPVLELPSDSSADQH